MNTCAKTNRMKGLLLVISLFCSAALNAQIKAEMQRMQERLSTLDSYRVNVTYAAGDTSDFFDEGNASVLVGKEGLFYQTPFALMIINQEHTFILNEDEKMLLYGDNKSVSRKVRPVQEYILNGMDTLIAQTDSVYVTEKGGKRTYFLRFSNNYFDLIEMSFKGDYLSEVTYYYNKEYAGESGVTAHCEVTIDENPTYDPLLLQSTYYITSTTGQTTPTEQFKGYVLVYNESIESYIE